MEVINDNISKLREDIKNKKRIVIKVGSSSLTHAETGQLDLIKLEVLVREICNLRNQNKDVILVTSGAIAVGKNALHIQELDKGQDGVKIRQACSAIGQAKLIMTYDKFFSEYNHTSAQILLTKYTIEDDLSRFNAKNTFNKLLELGVVPIVNENDTVATHELMFGDNDTLSAIVASLVEADLLILLSDIDGLYSDNPKKNPDAKFIDYVETIDDSIYQMGKADSGSKVGTGGMHTKLNAAKIATASGCDMIIANAADIRIIHRIMDGRNYGTLFKSSKISEFYLKDAVEKLYGE